MSTTKSKTDLVRMSWLTELRRQGERQCTDPFHCAMALLAEQIHGQNWLDAISNFNEVSQLAGLSKCQTMDVIRRNDGVGGHHTHTRAEIADVVAGWFPS